MHCQVCWKHISLRNVGARVTYEIEQWEAAALGPFRVVDPSGDHVTVPRASLGEQSPAALDRTVALRLLKAEKEALPQSLGQQVFQALCR